MLFVFLLASIPSLILNMPIGEMKDDEMVDHEMRNFKMKKETSLKINFNSFHFFHSFICRVDSESGWFIRTKKRLLFDQIIEISFYQSHVIFYLALKKSSVKIEAKDVIMSKKIQVINTS